MATQPSGLIANWILATMRRRSSSAAKRSRFPSPWARGSRAPRRDRGRHHPTRRSWTAVSSVMQNSSRELENSVPETAAGSPCSRGLRASDGAGRTPSPPSPTPALRSLSGRSRIDATPSWTRKHSTSRRLARREERAPRPRGAPTRSSPAQGSQPVPIPRPAATSARTRGAESESLTAVRRRSPVQARARQPTRPRRSTGPLDARRPRPSVP